jgi:hypothetical protein
MNPNDPMNGQLPPSPQPVTPQQNTAGQYGVVLPLYPAAATTPNNGHNPYEFIVSPGVKPKKLRIGGTQNRATRLLLIMAGFGVIVIILGIIITSLLPNNGSVQSLTTIAQEQQEIMRVAAQGEQQASSETAKGLAFTIDLSIGTSQNKLLAYLESRDATPKAKELALKADTATDATLTAALASSTYDTTFEKIMATQLQTYLSDVQQAYNNASKTDLKQILSDSYSAGKLLLDEVQANQTKS